MNEKSVKFSQNKYQVIRTTNIYLPWSSIEGEHLCPLNNE